MEMDLGLQNKSINIEDEVKSSFLDYAVSVIIQRALPDVRDGLKPVHRRILYAMNNEKLFYTSRYVKSARVVGDVLGKYHPHGDTAVYDSIVRMAQDFALRYPLVDGQGNFGSVDGDPAAAMRYTEIKMEKITSQLLMDLDKDTVDFIPNYDGRDVEPVVLPSKIPNLLINGSSGIAVGMSTNIPSHNLREVVDAVIGLIHNPELSIDDLLNIIPGPDFPTGAFIYGNKDIVQAYRTGRGILKLRGKYHIEEIPQKGRERIIITEIPYEVKKAGLIEKIADRVKNEDIEGIADIRDESDRHGIRISIDLKKAAQTDVIINQLYKMTPLQVSYGIIMISIVKGRPRLLNIKQMLEFFIEHRKDVLTRRTRFELRKAQERLHILAGLKIALDHLDAIITLIRKSSNPQEARDNLMEGFKLSKIQAQSILDMRLQRLTALERDKIIEEYNALLAEIKRLNEILADPKLLSQLILNELEEIKKDHQDGRKTQIIPDHETSEITEEDRIIKEDMAITFTHHGYIKATLLAAYKSQHRAGQGKRGMLTKEEDFVNTLCIANTHDNILFFTNKGKVYKLKVYKIPRAERNAKGQPIFKVLNIDRELEKITSILIVNEEMNKELKPKEGETIPLDFGEIPPTEAKSLFIIMATRRGIIKKTCLEDFTHISAKGLRAINLREDDTLIQARLSNGSHDVFLATRLGKAIRFHEHEIRDMGRTATGVRGIKLSAGDYIVGMDIVKRDDDCFLLTVTDKGYGKRSHVSEYRITGRYGKGIISIKTTDKNGYVVGIAKVSENHDIMLITNKGTIIRMNIKDNIPSYQRHTQGVRLITLPASPDGEEELVADLSILAEEA